jgi:Cys-tRNA(Pro) deacylase
MSKVRTRAIRALEEKQVPYRLLVQARRSRNVEEAAAERGVALSNVAKTLLIRRADRPSGPTWRHVVALVRGDQRLSLKKLARILSVKALEMAPAADVPRITGYQIGAVAPLGLRRTDMHIYVDEHIALVPRVSVSAGRHDAGLELDSQDLIRAVDGILADITE